MRSRESADAAQGSDESAVVSGRQSREQLGLHVDGVVGLEFEGLGGVVDDRGWTRRTGKRATTIGKAKAFADGVHDVSSGDHRYTGQIVRSGRRLIYRVLTCWSPWLDSFFEIADRVQFSRLC